MKLLLLLKRLFGMIKYNKELIGPRNHPIISPPVPIRRVIRELPTEVVKISGEKTYTQSEVEELINKASEDLSIELETKYTQNAIELSRELNDKQSRVLVLESEISRLYAKLEAKDLMLVELTKQVNNILNRGSNNLVDKIELTNLSIDMDTVFIDPSVKGAENKMQNHIIVEEVKGEGSNVKDSVNKLKNLLGRKEKL